MGRGRKKTRRIERVKSALIVLLSVTAILLTTQILPRQPLTAAGSGGTQGTGGQQTSGEETAAILPMRMAVTLRDDELQRYGVQYQRAESQLLFQQIYSLLLESLSSAGAPKTVGEKTWQNAIATAPGVYLDWQTEMPFSVLLSWFSVDNANLTGYVRRLILTEEGETVMLYWEGEDGYRMSEVTLVSRERLVEAASGLKDNGARFAFELAQLELLDPYTMVLGQTPVPKIYNVSNPISVAAAMDAMLERLEFPEQTSASYDGAGALVIRNEGDTLRVAADGTVTYEASDGGSGRYGSMGRDAASVVESCRSLAQQLLGGLQGEANLCLQSVEEEKQGSWTVRLDYTLNGVRVQTNQGCAAEFVVEDGTVARFRLLVRGYQDSGSTSVMLPERQAMAAMAARGHGGEELLLVYLDTGGQTASPCWAAAGELKSEG